MYLKENKSSTHDKFIKSSTSKDEKANVQNSFFEKLKKLQVMKTLNLNASMNTLDSNNSEIIQKKDVNTNPTGIPDSIKTYFENKSGLSFNDVRVHYNSEKPKKLNALAYTQNNHVYIGSGQERHLPHELGHVVQQRQGRVKPTIKMNGMAVNDDKRLEQEADKSNNIITSYHGELLHKNALDYAQHREDNVIQLLTDAQIFVLDDTIKKNATVTFGKNYHEILKKAPDVKTLNSWIDTASKLLLNYTSPTPSMDRKDAYEKYCAYIRNLLPTQNKPGVPMRIAITTAPTPVASSSATAQPKFADFIESIQKVNLKYHDHGNYKDKDMDISRKNIIEIIKAYKEAVYFLRLWQNSFEYKLDLNNDWCIIILVSKDTQTATITHFGPFGISTTVQQDVESAAYK